MVVDSSNRQPQLLADFATAFAASSGTGDRPFPLGELIGARLARHAIHIGRKAARKKSGFALQLALPSRGRATCSAEKAIDRERSYPRRHQGGSELTEAGDIRDRHNVTPLSDAGNQRRRR